VTPKEHFNEKKQRQKIASYSVAPKEQLDEKNRGKKLLEMSL